jgi:hypothetical protein
LRSRTLRLRRAHSFRPLCDTATDCRN